ncbi:MAG: cryptochrome/photolyase family protein, partial [Hydrogenophaga sp.]|nr:cryptochrome/photolyase family protein [Hydrogenophaga sp.]
MAEQTVAPIRHLVIVLGDQLDHDATALQGFDPGLDVVWMAEVAEESTHVWSSKQRIAIFLSSMRHFAAEVRERGLPLRYTRLDDAGNTGSLAGELQRAVDALKPQQLVLTAPGDWRVLQALRQVATLVVETAHRDLPQQHAAL